MRCLTLLALIGLWLVAPLRADELSTETQKIETLLAHISAQKDAVFIRNGAEYESATAAKFLRGKWERDREQIKTAREFIEKVATKSSTSGKPYLIKLKKGAEVECGQFLQAKLRELEGVTAAGKPAP